MKTSDLRVKLRELADRLEAANIPDGDARPSVDVYIHGNIKTREELAAWVKMMHDPQPMRSIDGISHWIAEKGDVDITVFYEAGLLGPVKKETVRVVEVEDTQDLSVLFTATEAADELDDRARKEVAEATR